jgi:hypothetical protein
MDGETEASSNIKIKNKKIKLINGEVQISNLQDPQQTIETLQSARKNIEDSLLSTRARWNPSNDMPCKPDRPSLVQKSLNNVKSIIRRAAEGLRSSQAAEGGGGLFGA